jgi:hypothetical protein
MEQNKPVEWVVKAHSKWEAIKAFYSIKGKKYVMTFQEIKEE